MYIYINYLYISNQLVGRLEFVLELSSAVFTVLLHVQR